MKTLDPVAMLGLKHPRGPLTQGIEGEEESLEIGPPMRCDLTVRSYDFMATTQVNVGTLLDL